MPKLSIVVPVYNVEKYLNQCIDSILGQSFTDFELIVIDDGSKDSSGSICDEYAKKDPRVVVVHTENHGVVTARKTGVSRAAGEYTAFVDSDDWLDLDFYRDIIEKADETNADIVICKNVNRWGKPVETTTFSAGYYDSVELENTVFPKMMYDMGEGRFHIIPSFWDKVFRTEFLTEVYKGVDPVVTLGEDAVCSYPCITRASSLFILENSACYHYREDHVSMVNNCDVRLLKRVCAMAVNMNQQFEKAPEIFYNQVQCFIAYNALYAAHQVMFFNREMSFGKRAKAVKSFWADPAVAHALKEARKADSSRKVKVELYFAAKNHPALLAFFKKIFAAKKRK